jgi:PTS system ascorbate-specific IIA component
MSVGLMLVSHEGIAAPMLAATERVLKVVPLKVGILEVPWAGACEAFAHQANQLLRELDVGHGVLILTDIFGATPANTCEKLEPCRRIRRVSGLNMPMLLRVLSYAHLQDLDALALIAYEGGRAGIVADQA